MRSIILVFGFVLTALGLVLILTPMPGTTLMVTLGPGMIICSSKRVENFVRERRLHTPRLNSWMTWIEDRVGQKLSAPLRQTRPDMPADDGIQHIEQKN